MGHQAWWWQRGILGLAVMGAWACVAAVSAGGFELLRLEPMRVSSGPTMDADLSGEWVAVSALPWEAATAGWCLDGSQRPVRNRDSNFQPLAVGGRNHPFGIGTHAPSAIVLDLGGSYRRFRATTWCGEAGGSVRFFVIGDERVLYQGPELRDPSEGVDVDIDLTGVARLQLSVEDCGDGIACDMANWGSARLLLDPTAARLVAPDKAAVERSDPRGQDARISVAAAGELRAMLASVPEMVRRDWYFRETLRAIEDWEQVVQWLIPGPEQQDGWSAVLPVPPAESGAVTVWPNPIPGRLLFSETGTAEAGWECGRNPGGEGWWTRVPGVAAGDDPEREHAWAEQVLGVHHDGAGDHNMWYHGYSREFESACRFAGRAASFGLRLENAPIEWHAGWNEIRCLLTRPGGGDASPLEFELQHYAPKGPSRAWRGEVVWAEGAETMGVTIPLFLEEAGGGLALLTIHADGERYTIPLFTYVEEVGSILTAIEGMLDAGATTEARRDWVDLCRLHAELLGQWGGGRVDGADWAGLFEAVSHLRDRLLWARIDFDTLLFVKRMPFISEQPYMDAHHLYNRPGGGIYTLSPVRPDGVVRPVVDGMGEGIYRDVCLSEDAQRLLFSFGQGSDDWAEDAQSYHIYEVGLDGGGLRQLTYGVKNDCEPVYAPNDRILFTSDRPEHFVMCGAARHAALLFSMDRDGGDLTQLSFNVVNDFNPSMLPDGRILYDRWEYNERSVTSLHSLFTMHPDGTMVAPFFGNQSIRPNVIMFPRAVPGSHKVMALLTGHHGQTHGPVALIDQAVAVNGMEAVEVLTPGIPVIGEKIEDSSMGWASRPWPLSEEVYLMSYTPTVVPWREASWAIYIGDRHGNKALVYRDTTISVTEPMPVRPTSRPQPLAVPEAGSDRQDEGSDALLLLVDAAMGQQGVALGEVKALRIIEDVPRKGVPMGSVIPVSATSMYTVKRVIGTVPVEADGSAYFRVPANRPLYFSSLDADGLEIQRMRSSICLKPGEVQTCLGCHEYRLGAPPNGNGIPLASRRAPSEPVPAPWGWDTLSFLRDVQPILERRCMPCHGSGRGENKVVLTGELTERYAVSYEELLPYIKTAYAMRWDVPYDVEPVPVRDFGSGASPLMRIIQEGHYGVELTPEEWESLAIWIDANGVYYGWYEMEWTEDRSILQEPWRSVMLDVQDRRCGACHSDGGAAARIPWPSVHPDRPLESSPLMAPLATAAGGWGRCGEVFLDRSNTDWQLLKQAYARLGAALKAGPRRDMLERD
ncbi:MAG: NPCBM/NEW2 domain-containing protein [Verrucomicrobiota bacterium]|nr:NPCBM/NEW2 domain-containing protein [Verrucomicrobiota bacterium]